MSHLTWDQQHPRHGLLQRLTLDPRTEDGLKHSCMWPVMDVTREQEINLSCSEALRSGGHLLLQHIHACPDWYTTSCEFSDGITSLMFLTQMHIHKKQQQQHYRWSRMVGSDGMEPARAGEPQIDQYGQRQSISGVDGGVGLLMRLKVSKWSNPFSLFSQILNFHCYFSYGSYNDVSSLSTLFLIEKEPSSRRYT